MAKRTKPDRFEEAKQRAAQAIEVERTARIARILQAEQDVISGATSRSLALRELCGPVFAVQALTIDERLTGVTEARALRTYEDRGRAGVTYVTTGAGVDLITASPIPEFLRGAIDSESWSTRDDVLRGLAVSEAKSRLDWLLELCGTPIIANGLPPALVREASEQGRGVRIAVFRGYDHVRRADLTASERTATLLPDLIFAAQVPPCLAKIQRPGWDSFDAVLRAVGVSPPRPTIESLIAAAGRPQPAAWSSDSALAKAAREGRAMRFWDRHTEDLQRIDEGLSIVAADAAPEEVDFVFAAPIAEELREIYIPISRDWQYLLEVFEIDPADPRYPPPRDPH